MFVHLTADAGHVELEGLLDHAHEVVAYLAEVGEIHVVHGERREVENVLGLTRGGGRRRRRRHVVLPRNRVDDVRTELGGALEAHVVADAQLVLHLDADLGRCTHDKAQKYQHILLSKKLQVNQTLPY